MYHYSIYLIYRVCINASSNMQLSSPDAEYMVYRICSSPCEVVAPNGAFPMMAVPQRQSNAVEILCSAAGAKLLLLKTCSSSMATA